LRLLKQNYLLVLTVKISRAIIRAAPMPITIHIRWDGIEGDGEVEDLADDGVEGADSVVKTLVTHSP
jgi:hypothetical protein